MLLFMKKYFFIITEENITTTRYGGLDLRDELLKIENSSRKFEMPHRFFT